MREQINLISERTFLHAVGGQLFEQAPNRSPRKAEIIMQKLRDSFRATAYNSNERYSLAVPVDKLSETVKSLLMAIPEFEELNLTQNEYEKGIDVNDPNRPKYAITTPYDKNTSESWRNDFIDLDAFIQNVVYTITISKEADKDCFLCIHENEKDKSICDICSVNPKIKSNYECERDPRGNHTFACKYDCYRSYYICCEECMYKDTCTNKCDSSSDKCGLDMNRVNNELCIVVDPNAQNNLELNAKVNNDKAYTVSSVVLNGETLSSMDEVKGRIDLSVLKPYIGQIIKVTNIMPDNKKSSCNSRITDVKEQPGLGCVLYLN